MSIETRVRDNSPRGAGGGSGTPSAGTGVVNIGSTGFLAFYPSNTATVSPSTISTSTGAGVAALNFQALTTQLAAPNSGDFWVLNSAGMFIHYFINNTAFYVRLTQTDGTSSSIINPGSSGLLAYYPANGTTLDDSTISTTTGAGIAALNFQILTSQIVSPNTGDLWTLNSAGMFLHYFFNNTAFYVRLTHTDGIASSQSAGLAGTGPFYLTHTSGNATIPNSKVLKAGSSVTTHTDSTSIYINATTGGGAASSGGLMSTGGLFVAWSSDTTMSNERVLMAGSSVTIITDATSIYINAITNSGAASSTPGSFFIMPEQAKLYANSSAARIDAGTPFFRLLFSPTVQQYGTFSFIVPADYSSAPYMRLFYGADSDIASVRSISWVVNLWGIAANQNRAMGYYADTFGGNNTVAIGLSAGYSSGTIQMLTIPLTTAVSFAAGRLINLRLSGSGGLMGNAEFIGGSLEYTKA